MESSFSQVPHVPHAPYLRYGDSNWEYLLCVLHSVGRNKIVDENGLHSQLGSHINARQKSENKARTIMYLRTDTLITY